jgi:hypothetical protein
MTPDSLHRTLEAFLAGSRHALVLENGARLFDLEHSKYAVSGEFHKCLLHLWSAERNVVRRVLDAEVKQETLRLSVQRMGQVKPSRLEICRERDARTPAARQAARLAYRQLLLRILERRFPGFGVTQLRTSPDLERSFGPVYTRGLLCRGQSAFAVLGVNAEETQASIDAALTFGILWLDLCRETQSARRAVEGLKLFVPAGASAVVHERMSRLNRDLAKWQLYELNEREDCLNEMDVFDSGNMATRLTHWADEAVTRRRFAAAIAQMHALLPEAEVVVLSLGEVAFRHHGLEFARAHLAHDADSLQSRPELVFGLGAAERVLAEDCYEDFLRLVRNLRQVRHADGPRHHFLWRVHPERWLESLVVRDMGLLDEQLDPACWYSQVPAFSASDRAMMDVLSVTRTGRLAVIELKADEDIHLPMQALDYWSRVTWHHLRGEFQPSGYFPGRELSCELPLLFLAAPALRVHPSTDTLLRYVSPAVDWTFLGLDEHWREAVRVVFRKRSLSASERASAA